MLTDNSIMPFGKKKGQKLGDISNGYLLKLYDTQKSKLSEELKDYIIERIPEMRLQRGERENMNYFAENLKFIRKELGWTQLQAARKILISEQLYQHYEYGKCEPDIDCLIIISELFYIDDLYLFFKKPFTELPLSTRILCATTPEGAE